MICSQGAFEAKATEFSTLVDGLEAIVHYLLERILDVLIMVGVVLKKIESHAAQY